MQKNILLLTLLVIILACKGKKSENKHIIKQYFSHFNKHEWKKMAEMYAENAEFKDPSLGPGIVKQTKQQIEKKYTDLNKIFADIHDKVVQIYPSHDNNIIVEFVSTGTAPDSTKFELPICAIFTIEKGKIIKDYTYYDNFEEK